MGPWACLAGVCPSGAHDDGGLTAGGSCRTKSHLVVLASGNTANTLLFRSSVTPTLMERIAAICRRRGFALLWPPPECADVRSPVTMVLLSGPGPFEDAGFDFSPATDNRPFFFQTLSLLHGTDALAKLGTGEREQSVTLLRRLAAIVTALTVALIFLPIVTRGRLPRGPWLGRRTTFFAAIGVAFMFVEIPLVQRLSIYLGHPSYATTIVLGALLLGAGVGARAAQRSRVRTRSSLRCWSRWRWRW